MTRRARHGRHRGTAMAALLGSALLAGCASIPSEGPVVDARQVEGGRGGLIQIFPAGPSATAAPAELIREFLRASAAFTNDHEVARSFLVPGYRLAWRPESPVVVYPAESDLKITESILGPGGEAGPPAPARSGAPSASPSGAPAASSPPPGSRAQVTLRVPVQARIDRSGQYTVAPPGTVETRSFDLVATEAGWRVSSLDQGILVSRYDLGSTFRSIPLYFADRTGTYLVPDVRWFPASVSGTTSTPAQVVSALLDGPAAWLAPAVTTGAPPGTQPTVNAVKVVEGVATVDLTEQARGADARQRLLLKAQLEHTLAGLSSVGTPVSSVVVTVDQQRFELQPGASATSNARDAARGASGLRPPPSVDARPVVLDSRGAVARLAGRSVQTVSGLGALVVAGSSAPATDAAGQAYAVLAAGRTLVLHAVPGGKALVAMRGRSFVPPSFDPFGWVWSAQEDAGREALAARPEAGTAHVRAAWLAGLKVRSLRISREGSRAVVVAQRPGSAPVVAVAGVVRTARGVPTGLVNPVRLLADATEATSAAWVDATHVVVLARRPGSAAMPWIVEIGGDAHGTLPVQALLVTAGNSESDLYVQTASGAVRSRVGSSWIDVPGVRWPSMPG